MLASRSTKAFAAVAFVTAVSTACAPAGTSDASGGSSGMSGGTAGTGPGGATSVVSCEFGDNASKCSGRDDESCAPAVIFGSEECERDEQCGERELCLVDQETGQAACSEVVGQCAPRCGGDFDCDEGMSCDPASGECIEGDVSGKGFGEGCEPGADECKGVCVEFSNGTAECEEHCRVGAQSGCGAEDFQGAGVACAYFAYDLSDLGVEQGAGDTGICARLCTCDDDCPGTQVCSPAPYGDFAGVCTGGLPAEQGIACEP